MLIPMKNVQLWKFPEFCKPYMKHIPKSCNSINLKDVLQCLKRNNEKECVQNNYKHFYLQTGQESFMSTNIGED